MTDCYRWIDPFEEVEQARQAGRDEVSALIERDSEDIYPHLLHRELLRLARDTARKMTSSTGLPDRIQRNLDALVARAIDMEAAMLMATSGGVAVRTYTDEAGNVRMDMFGMEKLFLAPEIKK